MSKIDINGTALELDLMEADVVGAFDDAVSEAVKRVQDKSQYEGKTNAEGFKYQCSVIDDFFDRLFGAGTSKKLFKGKENNLFTHMEAFAAVMKEGQAAADKMNSLISPFVPNRAQRRAENKKAKKGKKKVKGKKK